MRAVRLTEVMSVTITDHMQQVLTEQLAFIATSTADGVPNLGPKGSIQVHDEATLIYDETTGGQTLQNIRDGSQVVIAVVDRVWKNGYRFTGTTRVLESGELYEQRSQMRADRGKKAALCTVLVDVTEISTYRPVA